MTGRRVSRRSAILAGLGGAASARLGAGPSPQAGRGLRAVVVGAGAFGGWTALWLRRAGAQVTLVDAWGPGNARASSGGETRVLRVTYGPFRIYTEMVLRALELWRSHESAWETPLFVPTGALWMTSGASDDYARQAVPVLAELGVPHEELDPDDLARRYPQINPRGIRYALLEPGAGYLLARRGCGLVVEAFTAEGGAYRHAEAAPGRIAGGRMHGVRLSTGETLEADLAVFAAGPWLARLFPEFDPPLVRPTRQEIFYFGAPAGRPDLTESGLPVWVESGDGLFYGIPGSRRRGFKVADDARGTPFDPTRSDRTPSTEGVRAARARMERRFPAMRGAPLLEARVCQYEESPDGHFVLDTHPEAANAWIAGGGSGHGYKVGPALGEMLASTVLGERPKEPFFALDRFG